MNTRKCLVFAAVLCLAGVTPAQTFIPADVSCRTEGGVNADVNRSDSRKLSVRASSSGNKSWIKFYLGDFDGRTAGAATLTVFLAEGKNGSQSFDVSYVNDDCLDNINWGERDITWNNAPGNDTANLGLLDAAKTTYLATVDFADGPAGLAFEIDVLDAVQSDTDGIVQIVLHNSPNLIQIATHDHSDNPDWAPVLALAELHRGAKDPVPDHAASVETSLAALSWTNPDPNDGVGPITCDVYFGTDPNRPQMDKVTLPAGASSVDLTADNFPRFVPLANNVVYYWVVDCHDPGLAPADTFIPGLMWSFYTDNNNPPIVNAGLDQVAWLGMSGTAGQEVISLDGAASDDGLPKPAQLYVQWTQVANGAPAVTIAPDNASSAAVTITERGLYEFTLAADDSAQITEDTVRIVVGNNPCDASHLDTGSPYNAADQNADCIVDLADFAVLFAANWLDCTDMLTHCGK